MFFSLFAFNSSHLVVDSKEKSRLVARSAKKRRAWLANSMWSGSPLSVKKARTWNSPSAEYGAGASDAGNGGDGVDAGDSGEVLTLAPTVGKENGGEPLAESPAG